MNNPNLQIKHPGYEKANMVRSPSGSMQLTPERIKWMMLCGEEVIALEAEAERSGRDVERREYQEIVERYRLDYSKLSEYIGVAAAFGRSSGFPVEAVSRLPWRVLTLCARRNIPRDLQREIMHLLLHWLQHPGCPNVIEGKISVVQQLLDKRPYQIRDKYRMLQEELTHKDNTTWRPFVTPESEEERVGMPNAYSQVIQQQVRQAIENVAAQLQIAASEEHKQLQEQYTALQLENASMTTELSNARLHIAELQSALGAAQQEASEFQSKLAAAMAVLAEKEQSLNAINGTISNVVAAVKQAATVFYYLQEPSGNGTVRIEGEPHVMETPETIRTH